MLLSLGKGEDKYARVSWGFFGESLVLAPMAVAVYNSPRGSQLQQCLLGGKVGFGGDKYKHLYLNRVEYIPEGLFGVNVCVVPDACNARHVAAGIFFVVLYRTNRGRKWGAKQRMLLVQYQAWGKEAIFGHFFRHWDWGD